MNLIDKAIGYFNPKAGAERIRERRKYDNLIKIEKGYSNKDDPVLKNWNVGANSPDEDLLLSLEDLRAKSRNLYMNNDLAGAALKKMRTKKEIKNTFLKIAKTLGNKDFIFPLEIQQGH